MGAEVWIEEAVGRAQEAPVLFDQVPDSQRDVRLHDASSHLRPPRSCRLPSLPPFGVLHLPQERRVHPKPFKKLREIAGDELREKLPPLKALDVLPFRCGKVEQR